MRARLADLIAGERIDIVHAQSAGAAWSALAATHRMPVFLVTSFPDRLAANSWPSTLFDSSLARGDRVIAPSSYVSRAMIERYKIPPDRITVIPRSVDTATLQPGGGQRRPHRRAAPRLGHSAANARRAGRRPDRAVERPDEHDRRRAAFGRRRRPQHRLRVRRRGSRADALCARAAPASAACTASTRCAALSAIAPTCRRRCAAADVVVVPALEPPLSGRAVAEAQAIGRPVIATTVGVLPENVLCPPRMRDELRTGWLVRPGNVGELARAIAAALALDVTVLRGARRPRAPIRRIRVFAAERCRSHSWRLYLAAGARRLTAMRVRGRRRNVEFARAWNAGHQEPHIRDRARRIFRTRRQAAMRASRAIRSPC